MDELLSNSADDELDNDNLDDGRPEPAYPPPSNGRPSAADLMARGLGRDNWQLECRRWRRFAVLVFNFAAPEYANLCRRLFDSQILDSPSDRHNFELTVRFALAQCSHHLDRLDQAPHDIGWRELAREQLLPEVWPAEQDEQQAEKLGAVLAPEWLRLHVHSETETPGGMTVRERQAARRRRVVALCREQNLHGQWAKLRELANSDLEVVALELKPLTAENCRKMVPARRKATQTNR